MDSITLDPDPDPNWTNTGILDPDPISMYLDPQNWLPVLLYRQALKLCVNSTVPMY